MCPNQHCLLRMPIDTEKAKLKYFLSFESDIHRRTPEGANIQNFRVTFKGYCKTCFTKKKTKADWSVSLLWHKRHTATHTCIFRWRHRTHTHTLNDVTGLWRNTPVLVLILAKLPFWWNISILWSENGPTRHLQFKIILNLARPMLMKSQPYSQKRTSSHIVAFSCCGNNCIDHGGIGML